MKIVDFECADEKGNKTTKTVMLPKTEGKYSNPIFDRIWPIWSFADQPKGTVDSSGTGPLPYKQMIDLVRQLNGNLNRMNTANNAALTKLMSGDVTSQDLDKFDDLSNTITGSLDQLMGPLAKMEKAMLGGTLIYIWWWWYM